MEANEAYGIRLAALRRKAHQLDALVERLDNPPDVDYGYVGDLAHVNSILDEALDTLGEHADAVGELRERERESFEPEIIDPNEETVWQVEHDRAEDFARRVAD